MYVSVCEGRAVVKNKFRLTGVFLLNSSVKIRFFPVLDACGFAFYEISAHGELGVGKIESVFEVFF